MKLLLFSFLALALHQSASAYAEQSDPQLRYREAVARIQSSRLMQSHEVSETQFGRFDWVGKTALINVLCQQQDSKRCQSALKQGLRDPALVVRDHALRVVLTAETISDDVKRKVAQSVVSDERNYRKGRAFWIVQNAQKFLEKTD